MPKGYWVALIDVSDPEGYKGYVTENAKAFRKYDALRGEYERLDRPMRMPTN